MLAVVVLMSSESVAFTSTLPYRHLLLLPSSSSSRRCVGRGSDPQELGRPTPITQPWQWKIPALSAMLAVSLAVAPAAPALAVVDPSVFTNEYADPLHPQCLRRIEVSKDGTTFHYSGTAVGPKDDPVLRGCSAQEIKEFGIRRGQFDGLIVGDGKISAGNGVHEGVWEPAYSVSGQSFDDVDGIRWNDGNKWTVVKKSWTKQVGEFIFLSYISVSMAAGAKGLYDGIQRKRVESN